MMQSSIYSILVLATISAAKQLDFGPKVSKEPSQFSESAKSSDNRYTTKEIILYLTPSEIKSLQATKSMESSAENQNEEQEVPLQDYNNEQQQNAWSQYFKLMQVEAPNREEEKRVGENMHMYENRGNNVDAYNFESEQQSDQEKQQNIDNQEEQERQESECDSFNSAAAKKQEEALWHDQLQQRWDRILNHNRVQLRGLSVIGKEHLEAGSFNEDEKPAERWQSTSTSQEDNKSDIEKQIELILKETSEFDHVKQRPPIVIHKEVRIIKHHPFPVVEKIKVPRPIFVPVPEPYEVKVPHPYPVPLEILKHIPVPVIRNK